MSPLRPPHSADAVGTPPLFGECALDLNPLAVTGRRDDEDQVLLRVARTPAARERLAALPGTAADGPLLRLSRSRLAAYAEDPDGPAACLVAAWDAAAAEPGTPRVMGILNVTPDSFSDGGLHQELDAAVAHARRMRDEGADWVDVGGESTRPGAERVPVEVELERVLPVIAALADEVPISIDTTKAEVARRAVEAGARMVNDVSAGLEDPAMLATVAELGVRYVAMHRQGAPADMQRAPAYTDAVAEVAAHLRERTAACLKAGIELHKIVLDPGIGFGKRLEHNLELLKRLPELRSLGRPLLLGVSRKSFIGHVTQREKPEDWLRREAHDRPADRTGGTIAAVTACVLGGAELLRVHDVAPCVEAVAVASALRTSRSL